MCEGILLWIFLGLLYLYANVADMAAADGTGAGTGYLHNCIIQVKGDHLRSLKALGLTEIFNLADVNKLRMRDTIFVDLISAVPLCSVRFLGPSKSALQ